MKDIHTHILFDVDDGSESIDESAELCQISYMNNVTDIILTPHFYSFDDVDERLQICNGRMELLREKLAKEQIDVSLYLGAEVFADEDIMFADCLDKLTLCGSRYMLVEFEFYKISVTTVVKYIRVIKDAGIIPVIAHPERYGFLHKDYENLNILLNEDVLLQVNASSLAGQCGKADWQLAGAIVNSGLADFIASDAHSVSHRPSNLFEMLQESDIALSSEEMEEILEKNPDRIINNEDIVPMNRDVYFKKKKRFGL